MTSKQLAFSLFLFAGAVVRAAPVEASPSPAPAALPPTNAAAEAAAATTAARAFETWFARQLREPRPLPDEALAAARRYRFVFVAGFLNEGFQSGYFSENRKALLDAGTPADAIHIVFPASSKPVDDGIAQLVRDLPALAARGPEKLVIVGHSKGAVEALGAALGSSPAFLREHVEALFLVQGAFGGSGVADYVKGRGHPVDGRMPLRPRAAFEVAAQGGKLLDLRLDQGMDSLTHDYAARLWSGVAGGSGSGAALDALSGKVFFIRSRQAPERVSPIVGVTAHYLTAYYGDNDGLVATGDQLVPGIGRILATLDADHAGLTATRPVSNRGPEVRRAFTAALLMQLAGAFDRTPALASAPAALPETVTFRTRTESFNRMYESAVRGGQLWMKAIHPARGARAGWFPVDNPPAARGRLVEISSDDEYVVAIDEARRIHTLFGAYKPPDAFRWHSAWGKPGKPRWGGPGMTLPPDNRGWAISFFSPREDAFLRLPAAPRYPFWIGSGVTTIYALGADGRRITMLDPWLPPDVSQEVCGPDRGRFQSVALSASGSTLFVIGRHGEMFTRLYDFDIAGGDYIFFRYSYEDQNGDLLRSVPMPLIGAKLSPIARPLPPPDWVAQPAIAGGARITARISVSKGDGKEPSKGGLHRVLRVAGVDGGGQTGYFEKDVADAAWQFHATGEPEAALGPFLEAPGPGDGRGGGAPAGAETNGDDRPYRGEIDGVPVELADFNPYCSPARVVFHFPAGDVEARLHTSRRYSTDARPARGLSPVAIAYQGNLELTQPLPAHARKLLSRFKTRWNWVDVAARDGDLTLSGPFWKWKLSHP